MKPTTEIQMANTRMIWTTYRETGLDPESKRRGRPKTKLWKMLLTKDIELVAKHVKIVSEHNYLPCKRQADKL